MKFYEREPFDDQKVEAIRVQLTNLAAAGNPSDFQIILDDMEIVPRTSNVEQFTSFYDLLGPKTESLVINVFSGSTRHKRTYSYYFNEGKQSNGLNGVDTQKIIDEKVQLHALQFENKMLNEHVKDLKAELVALEQENEQLKADNQEMREDLNKATGENGMASTVIGGMKDLFQTYMGPPKQNAPALSGPPAGMVNVSIQEYDQFKRFQSMIQQFDQQEFNKVLHILGYLAENKPAIDETMRFLTEEENENPNDNDSQEDHH
jgi:regulator of replication initiation timing